MVYIVKFRTLKGEQLLTKTLKKQEEIESALKLDIGHIITLEIQGNKRNYKIVGMSERYAAPKLFNQNGEISANEFVVEPIEESVK